MSPQQEAAVCKNSFTFSLSLPLDLLQWPAPGEGGLWCWIQHGGGLQRKPLLIWLPRVRTARYAQNRKSHLSLFNLVICWTKRSTKDSSHITDPPEAALSLYIHGYFWVVSIKQTSCEESDSCSTNISSFEADFHCHACWNGLKIKWVYICLVDFSYLK